MGTSPAACHSAPEDREIYEACGFLLLRIYIIFQPEATFLHSFPILYILFTYFTMCAFHLICMYASCLYIFPLCTVYSWCFTIYILFLHLIVGFSLYCSPLGLLPYF